MILKGNIKDILGILQTKLPNPKAVSVLTDYYRDFIQIGESNLTPRDLYLYPLNKERLEKTNERFVLVMGALCKFTDYVLNKDNGLLNNLGISGLDIEGIKKRDSNYTFCYARIDSIFNGKDYRIIEVNAKRPQIYEDTDWLSSYLKYIFGRRIKEEKICIHIAKAIKSGIYLNTKSYPEYIIIFSAFIRFIEKEKRGSFFFKAIQNVFPLTEIVMISCEELDKFYNELELRKDFLFYKNKKVDLLIFQDLCTKPARVFNNNGSLFDERIRRAFNKKTVEIETPLSSWIVGNKISLSLISDNNLQNKIGLNEKEKNALNLVLENFYIEDVTEAKQINKNEYVVKVPEKGGGKGVYAGTRMSQKKFNSLVAKLLEENEDLILQRKAYFGLDKIINLQNFKEEMAAITLDPFLVNNPSYKKPIKVVGYSSRAILESKIKKVPVFNPAIGREEIMFGSVILLD